MASHSGTTPCANRALVPARVSAALVVAEQRGEPGAADGGGVAPVRRRHERGQHLEVLEGGDGTGEVGGADRHPEAPFVTEQRQLRPARDPGDLEDLLYRTSLGVEVGGRRLDEEPVAQRADQHLRVTEGPRPRDGILTEGERPPRRGSGSDAANTARRPRRRMRSTGSILSCAAGSASSIAASRAMRRGSGRNGS